MLYGHAFTQSKSIFYVVSYIKIDHSQKGHKKFDFSRLWYLKNICTAVIATKTTQAECMLEQSWKISVYEERHKHFRLLQKLEKYVEKCVVPFSINFCIINDVFKEFTVLQKLLTTQKTELIFALCSYNMNNTDRKCSYFFEYGLVTYFVVGHSSDKNRWDLAVQ